TADVADLSDSANSGHEIIRALEQQIRLIQDRRSATAVFYFSAHGATNAEGTPCLIAPNASPSDASEWTPVSEILNELKNLPAHTKKLVVLDCTRLDACWPIGLLYNSFADRLPSAVRAAKDPNLFVLCSSGPGQKSWPSKEGGRSVFGHFFLVGLAGAADQPHEGGDESGEVTLQELERYVRRQVSRWASENRDAVQQPLLIASEKTAAKTFNLIPADYALAQRLAAAEPESSSANVPEAEIQRLWEQHQKLVAGQSRVDPLDLREYELKLLWLEQLADAGPAERGASQTVIGVLDNLFAEATAHAKPPPLRAHSLALAKRFGWLREPSQQPDGNTNNGNADAGDQGGDRFPSKALSAWRAAQGEVRAESLRELLEGVPQPSGEFSPGFIETHFLKMLDLHLDAATWETDSSWVAKAIESRNAAEQAAAPDQRAQYWAVARVEAGDQARRQAEDRLFIGQPDSLREAKTLWDEAAEEYRRAREEAQQVEAALEQRNEAFREASHFAIWLTHPQPKNQTDADVAARDARINRQLLPLIQKTRELSKLLESDPEARPEAANRIHAAAETLRADLSVLRGEFDEQCTQLLDRAGNDQEVMRQI
ncbi:MAG: caspase family protein, partial [Planctomycetales bacterium]